MILWSFPRKNEHEDRGQIYQETQLYFTSSQNGGLMKKGTLCLLVFAVLVLVGLTAQAGNIKSAGIKGNWSSPSTWIGGGVPGPSDNVTIANRDSVIIDVNVVIASLTVGEGDTTACVFNRSTSVKVTINGDLLIKSGGSLKVWTRPTGGLPEVLDTLIITGNLTNQGAFDMRNGSSGSTLSVCAVVFTGSSNSTVTMGPYNSSTNEFNGIVINKSGNGRVILGSDIYSAGGSSSQVTADPIWQFTRGIVETGPYAMVHNWTSGTSNLGCSDSSYVLGSMGRGMSNSQGSDKIFQVGDAKGYRPVKVRSTTSGSATGHYVRVQAVYGNANPGSATFAGGIDKVSAVRYYKVTYVQGAGAPDMTFDRVTAAYGLDDGVAAGNQNLRVATADTTRLLWTSQGPVATPFTTAMDSLPRQMNGDPFTTPIKLVSGQSMYFALARVTGTKENTLGGATAVEQISGIPTSFALEQNYPNPFNPSTTIKFQIAKAGFVTLKMFDMLGREVSTLVSQQLDAGSYQSKWDASGYASGMYLYMLQQGNSVETRKLMLVK
jgi:hypothetical protein